MADPVKGIPIVLHGGRFDGLEAWASAENVRLGFVMCSDCPRHGPESCGCVSETILIYGYYAERGKGSGHFTVADK